MTINENSVGELLCRPYVLVQGEQVLGIVDRFKICGQTGLKICGQKICGQTGLELCKEW